MVYTSLFLVLVFFIIVEVNSSDDENTAPWNNTSPWRSVRHRRRPLEDAGSAEDPLPRRRFIRQSNGRLTIMEIGGDPFIGHHIADVINATSSNSDESISILQPARFRRNRPPVPGSSGEVAEAMGENSIPRSREEARPPLRTMNEDNSSTSESLFVERLENYLLRDMDERAEAERRLEERTRNEDEVLGRSLFSQANNNISGEGEVESDHDNVRANRERVWRNRNYNLGHDLMGAVSEEHHWFNVERGVAAEHGYIIPESERDGMYRRLGSLVRSMLRVERTGARGVRTSMSSQTCDVCDVSAVRQQERQVELDSLCNRASSECSVWLQNAYLNAVNIAQRALTDTLWIVGRVLNNDREGEQLRLATATWDSLRTAMGTALDRGAEAIEGARLTTPSPSTSAPQNSTPSTSSSEQKAECIVCYGVPDRYLRPCGHVLCSDCVALLQRCPHCKSGISHTLSLFL